MQIFNDKNNLVYFLIFAVFLFVVYSMNKPKESFKTSMSTAIARAACGGCTSVSGTCCTKGCTWYGTCK